MMRLFLTVLILLCTKVADATEERCPMSLEEPKRKQVPNRHFLLKAAIREFRQPPLSMERAKRLRDELLAIKKDNVDDENLATVLELFQNYIKNKGAPQRNGDSVHKTNGLIDCCPEFTDSFILKKEQTKKEKTIPETTELEEQPTVVELTEIFTMPKGNYSEEDKANDKKEIEEIERQLEELKDRSWMKKNSKVKFEIGTTVWSVKTLEKVNRIYRARQGDKGKVVDIDYTNYNLKYFVEWESLRSSSKEPRKPCYMLKHELSESPISREKMDWVQQNLINPLIDTFRNCYESHQAVKHQSTNNDCK